MCNWQLGAVSSSPTSESQQGGVGEGRTEDLINGVVGRHREHTADQLSQISPVSKGGLIRFEPVHRKQCLARTMKYSEEHVLKHECNRLGLLHQIFGDRGKTFFEINVYSDRKLWTPRSTNT